MALNLHACTYHTTTNFLVLWHHQMFEGGVPPIRCIFCTPIQTYSHPIVPSFSEGALALHSLEGSQRGWWSHPYAMVECQRKKLCRSLEPSACARELESRLGLGADTKEPYCSIHCHVFVLMNELQTAHESDGIKAVLVRPPI